MLLFYFRCILVGINTRANAQTSQTIERVSGLEQFSAFCDYIKVQFVHISLRQVHLG